MRNRRNRPTSIFFAADETAGRHTQSSAQAAPKLRVDSFGPDQHPQTYNMVAIAGLEVGKVGFGAMGMAFAYGPPMTEADAAMLLTAIYESGYRHLDTSEIYASTFPKPDNEDTVHCETLIGKWLAMSGIPRSEISIATKCNPAARWGGKTDPETVAQMVEASLARLGTDYIDVYYLHRLPPQGPEEFVQSMLPILACGKVKALGISEASAANIRKAHAIAPLALAQYEWSLLERGVESEIVPTCKELGITVVAYSPLARNLLALGNDAAAVVENRVGFRAGNPRFDEANLETNLALAKVVSDLAAAKGTTAASLSLAWLLHQAAKFGVALLPIPGSTKAAHAAENLAASAIELTDEDADALEDLAARVAGERGAAWYMASVHEAQKAKEASK
jgi:aryl-alcohol dehydrogenase-like predicted oxidoreductase